MPVFTLFAWLALRTTPWWRVQQQHLGCVEPVITFPAWLALRLSSCFGGAILIVAARSFRKSLGEEVRTSQGQCVVQHCSHCVVTVFTLLRGFSISYCVEPVIMLHALIGVEAVFIFGGADLVVAARSFPEGPW